MGHWWDAFQAFPIYYEMVRTLTSYTNGDKEACMEHLENINSRLRGLLLIFFDRMNDTKVARSVWLSYIQGFQGWGVGRIINGEYFKYDGVSANQVLVFQAVDAFLGLDRYLTDEGMGLYIPRRQRDLCASLRAHSIRSQLCEQKDAGLITGFAKIVNQMRVCISKETRAHLLGMRESHHVLTFVTWHVGLPSRPPQPGYAIFAAARHGAVTYDG